MFKTSHRTFSSLLASTAMLLIVHFKAGSLAFWSTNNRKINGFSAFPFIETHRLNPRIVRHFVRLPSPLVGHTRRKGSLK